NGEAVMELLRELHREGATICMVTHDPRYARHADRSIHLFDGRVVEEVNGTIGVPRVTRIVGDHADRRTIPVQLAEQLHDGLAVL
ncbi:MAG: hypothetical protein M3468_04375, partial [Acidobacteriota bacterium]|nr:hypothetical protein [Acidobacteriota bacterium]